jgi:SAM-dependent methyltransferase
MVGHLLHFVRLLYKQPAAQKRAAWSELKPLLKNRFLARAARKPKANPPPPLLFQMASSYWLSQAIYVAAKLGIADLLVDGPQSCATLAAVTRSDEASLFRVMRALASAGIFSHLEDGRFALSQLAEGLQSAVPGSLSDAVITLGEIHYQACGALLHSVQTGDPAFNKVFGAGLFDYLGRHPEAAGSFNRGMTNLASMLAYAVVFAYDFAGISSVVDVGGGEGRFLEKILEFHPGMRGTVFDSTVPVGCAERTNRAGTRCSYVWGNFFDCVPAGADAYFVCGVLHDWDDDRALRVLGNCRRAISKNGKLLLLEMVVPPTVAADFSKLLDLNMLVMTGGRERTSAEFSALLGRAGYRMTRIIPTLAPQSLIESVPK